MLLGCKATSDDNEARYHSWSSHRAHLPMPLPPLLGDSHECDCLLVGGIARDIVYDLEVPSSCLPISTYLVLVILGVIYRLGIPVFSNHCQSRNAYLASLGASCAPELEWQATAIPSRRTPPYPGPFSKVSRRRAPSVARRPGYRCIRRHI